MNTNTIDESLYSRQLYVLGKDAMMAMKNANILISGLNGVGVEIAKCVILSGVKSVTLHDTQSVTLKDLTSNYYASPENIGQLRTNVVHKMLSQLNPYVNVVTDSTALCEDHFKTHQVVVICSRFVTDLTHYGTLARKYGAKFVSANTYGLYGYIFCDFGDKFIISDIDGELTKMGIITTCRDNIFSTSEPHDLSVGDTIELDIAGNKKEVIVKNVINTKDSWAFSLENVTHTDGILKNSSFKQIKVPTQVNFLPIDESMNNPEFATIISSDFERQNVLHAFNMALDMFIRSNKRFPNKWDDTDADTMVKLTESLSKEKTLSDAHKSVVKRLSYTCGGRLCPVDSVIGSIAGQEVIKATSGKFTPIKQWFYFDALNVLKEDHKPNVNLTNTRYDGQISIFGDELNDKIQNSKIFIVGSGAIGCEHLKNYAMMGIKNIVITDMDRIEKSNLNRQFLFRGTDIGKYKSIAASQAVKKMNSDINVVADTYKVAFETLDIYSNKFFSEITAVTTALDNVQARIYVDSLCVKNKVPMIDSGTLGTKCNVQVVVPHLTETYGSSADPQEKTIPLCTLKYFPHQIEHCIQWGRDLFEGLFVSAPSNYMRYKKNPSQVQSLPVSELVEIVNDILLIKENMPINSDGCIEFAYKQWHKYFRDQIYQLTLQFPADSVTAEGLPFWSGTKLFPSLTNFDINNEDHIQFIEAVANLWGDVFSINHVTRKGIKKWIADKMPPAIPQGAATIKLDQKSKEEEVTNVESLLEKLPSAKDLRIINPLEFEKDVDTNFHIDFVTCASNLRAFNYNIPGADKLKTKGIAGKIIPAIATTTSLVSGLVSLELIKVIQGFKKIDQYSNSFANLAISMFAFSDPIEVKYTTFGKHKFSLWDGIEMKDPTVRQVIEKICQLTECEADDIESICSDAHMIYSSFNNKHKKERLDMNLSDIYKKLNEGNKLTNPFRISAFISSENENADPINIDIVY